MATAIANAIGSAFRAAVSAVAPAVTYYRKLREGGVRLTTAGDNRIYRH